MLACTGLPRALILVTPTASFSKTAERELPRASTYQASRVLRKAPIADMHAVRMHGHELGSANQRDRQHVSEGQFTRLGGIRGMKDRRNEWSERQGVFYHWIPSALRTPTTEPMPFYSAPPTKPRFSRAHEAGTHDIAKARDLGRVRVI